MVSTVGLPELVGNDVNDYVRIAAALANDVPRVVALRASMRDRVNKSPLRDEKAFCRRFEGALREVWRSWCAARKS